MQELKGGSMKKIIAMLIVAALVIAPAFAGGGKEEVSSAPLPEFKDTITIATCLPPRCVFTAREEGSRWKHRGGPC